MSYPELHDQHHEAWQHTQSSGKWWSRMSLRLMSLLACIATVSVSGYYYMHWTLGPLIMLGPPAGVAILWDFADVIHLSIRRNQNGIHPNACIMIDSLLFLGLGALSGVIAFTLSKLNDSGYYFAFFQDEAGKEYLHVVLGFGILAAILHLVIAIMAWREPKTRPTQPAPQIIYVHTNQQPMATADTEMPPAYSLHSHTTSQPVQGTARK